MEYVTQMSTMLATGEEQDTNEWGSNCCGARTSEPDKDGLAVCSDCKEHCVEEELVE